MLASASRLVSLPKVKAKVSLTATRSRFPQKGTFLQNASLSKPLSSLSYFKRIVPSHALPIQSLELGRITKQGYHSSLKVENSKRKKMKLRRNRRLAGMSNDIEAHLTKDEELRKSMLQQTNTVMDPDEDLPLLLKQQIQRELKDTRMQETFKSGPDGRKQVIDHFRTMGTQIDRLYNLKELEKRVLEKEKRIARGEEVSDEINAGEDELPIDLHARNARQLLTPDPTSNNPADLIETEFRKYNAYRDSYTQSYETVDSSQPDPLEALARVQNPEHLPPEIRKGASMLAGLGSSDKKSVKKPITSYELEEAPMPVAVPRNVVDPSFQTDSSNLNELEDDELPSWPSPEEIAAADAEMSPIISETPEKDLSQASHLLRAERLRRQHEQDVYMEEMANSPVPPLPFVYRQLIQVKLKLGQPIEDRFILPFVPPGMTAQEFLVAEELVPEESAGLEFTQKDMEGDESAMVDTETSIAKVEGSCCTSLREATEKRHFGCLSVLCDPAHGLAPTGETPLHIAAILEDVNCVRELIDRKVVDVNAPASISRSSALHSACVRGNMEVVKLLIQKGARVNHADCDGLTALHMAVAAGGSTSLVNYLIDQKANQLQSDNQGAIALHIAADGGNLALVRLLLAKGSPVNSVTSDHETPLFLACEQGHLEVVQLLLANGADANLMNAAGSHPIHAAAKQGSLSIVKTLLEAKTNAFVMDTSNNTPLHIAALEGHVDIAKQLIAAGCPIAAPTSEGWTALHIAAQSGYAEMINLLVDVGSSIRAVNDEGSSVLHIALSSGKFDIIPLLLEKGADVNAGDMNNITPLLLSIQVGREDLALLFIQKGARTATLTSDAVAPLHMALEEGLYDLANTLLSMGASPVQETMDGYQPIHIVVARGDEEWTKKLILLGANPNAITQVGLTPLRIAQENGLEAIESLLRDHGAREMDIFAWMELEAEAKAKRQESRTEPSKNSL